MTGAIDYRHVSILWASPEHAPELAQLHAGLFAKAWDADSFLRLLPHPGSPSFLARFGPAADRRLHRQPARCRRGGDPHADVRKDSQRHGIARRLVGHGPRRQNAEVRRLSRGRAGDVAAIGLYTGLGFKESGGARAVRAPGRRPEDALVLALALKRHEPRCGGPASHPYARLTANKTIAQFGSHAHLTRTVPDTHRAAMRAKGAADDGPEAGHRPRSVCRQ